ncbi:MAG: RNA polymerase sigma factor RpoD/SigA [Candidatus Woesearchaeota archaeon]
MSSYINGNNGNRTYRNDSTLDTFLEEISRIPLLTPNQEIVYGKGAQQGDETAIEKLVEANLRLVVDIAKIYRYMGLEFKDLIQEGTLGLMEFAGRYDPDRGYRFSTGAGWWIRKTIREALSNQSRNVRNPIHFINLSRKVGKAASEFYVRTGSYPTDEHLSEELDIPIKDIEQVRDKRLTSLGSILDPLSCSDDGSGNYYAHRTSIPIQQLEASELVEELLAVVCSDQEAVVVGLYRGLNGFDRHTFDEVGETLGMTGEWARKLERRAVAKMRKRAANMGLCSHQSA